MADVKKIGLDKPVQVRMMDGDDQVYMVTIREKTLEIRPKGARTPGSTVFVSIGSLYRRALMVRVEAEKPTRRRRTVKRGLL